MKSVLKFIIVYLLSWRARRFLKQHRTQVIAITGSVGKTSTKQAIHTVLKPHFKVYASPEGFNTPIGVSLAILQEDASGFSSPLKWLKILWRSFFEKKAAYPKMILEMGADQPGDIKRLLRIAEPKIGVITRVAPVHLADGQFKDVHAIAQEKGELVAHLKSGGMAVLNADDPLVCAMPTPGKKMTFGLDASATVRASEVHATSKHLRFVAHYKGESAECVAPVLGAFNITACLAAISVGLQLGLTLDQCTAALRDLHLPPGRMNPIAGLEGAHIIDSSYNASPQSMTVALDLLNSLKAERKIAALGTMNELGETSDEAHIYVAKRAAQIAQLLIFVGPEASTYKKAALEAGFGESNIYTFFDSEEAGHFLKPQLQKGDLILAKGSQNRVRMERFVKVIMAHPEKAPTLLCRQDGEWNSI